MTKQLNRTVSQAKITVARDSMGGVNISKYLDALERAILEMPDVTADTEVSVFLSDVTSYSGTYSDSEPWQYDALAERLSALAEDVFHKLCSE
jgi:hypothetical protein